MPTDGQQIAELADLIDPAKALVRVRGFWRSYRLRDESYTLTVYGVGEPGCYNGRLEFKQFVAVIEWDVPFDCGPKKDFEAIRQEVSDLQYRIAYKDTPVKVAERTSLVRVTPIHYSR